jgi:hypothetical protein
MLHATDRGMALELKFSSYLTHQFQTKDGSSGRIDEGCALTPAGRSFGTSDSRCSARTQGFEFKRELRLRASPLRNGSSGRMIPAAQGCAFWLRKSCLPLIAAWHSN